MAAVNGAVTALFNLFFAPFASLHPWVGLSAVSLLSGLLLLLLFRATSNQRALKRTKDRLFSHLFEVVLYRDEMRVVARAQGRLLVDNLRYLSFTLLPLLAMVLPGALLLLQIDLHYGRRPLRVGEPALVRLQLQGDLAQVENATLSVPTGVTIETPSLRLPQTGEVDWRISATKPGRYELRFAVGDTQVTKTLVVAERGGPVAAQRVGPGALAQLLHPGEAPLPAGPISALHVAYPTRLFALGSWSLLWIWPWLVLSMVFGYALRGPLHVAL